MQKYEAGICSGCGQPFECKADFIDDCDCSKVVLTARQREALAAQYDSCLCYACLLVFQAVNSAGKCCCRN